jgi:hypothetical protein
MHPLTRQSLSRRTLLRGAAGASLALPLLEAMWPRAARAARRAARALAPRRLVFLYVPNGVIVPQWEPKRPGPELELTPTLEPLAELRSEILLMGGLDQHNGNALGDGPGDHARAAASYLTGAHPRKSATSVLAGTSVDQAAASRIGHLTRLGSLELACDRPRLAGVCDSGYGCAYQYSLAWKNATTPLPSECDPRLLFDRLFAGGRASPEDRRRRADDRSVLDYVRGEAEHLGAGLGKSDRDKVDEYLTAIRDVEKRIQGVERLPARRLPPGVRRPASIPDDHQQHLRLMTDVMALALETDTTRIVTFMFGYESGNRSYPFAGSSEGHHELSHHMNDAAKVSVLAKIDRFNVEQLAYVLGRLRRAREADGTLLDNSFVLYGSGLKDGNRHEHTDLPLILAGRGAGAVRPGRYARWKPGTPMCNLFVTLLDHMGAPHDRFGDSTGPLEGLA